MSKSNHTEAQIIEALKQLEAGRKAEDIGRQHGVSKHTIYAWKAKYGGMDVSQAQELRQVARREHSAEEAGSGPEPGQGHAAIGNPKKLTELAVKKAEVQQLIADFASSERHACELMSIPRSTCRYCNRHQDDGLRERLISLAREKPRFGYRRLHVLLHGKESASITNGFSACIALPDCASNGSGASGSRAATRRNRSYLHRTRNGRSISLVTLRQMVSACGC